MTECGKKVTHSVRVVGKRRVGYCCFDHLDAVKNVAVSENVELHIESYRGEKMLCELPAKIDTAVENKLRTIFLKTP